ncbi:cytochrome P450 [Amylocystis lapponica]|nr:cytochrome P450 [Amylocystis lapponica]
MLSATTLVVLFLPTVVTTYVLSAFLRLLLRQALSPLRHLSGPPSPSFFMGNLREMHDQENNDLIGRWEACYGSTFVYHGFIGGCRLMTTDPVAVAHIMGRAYDYPKPDFVRDSLASMVAGKEGLLTVEGEVHRRQSPAFSSPYVRSLSPIFWAKAVQLRDIWRDIIALPPTDSPGALPNDSPSDPLSPSNSSREPEMRASTTAFLPNPFSSFVSSKARSHNAARHPVQPNDGDLTRELDDALLRKGSPEANANALLQKVDVLAWLARATLDVIGEAGFGYPFDSLALAAGSAEDGESESELARAFGIIFDTARKFRVTTILQVWFPVLRRFQRNSAAMKEAQATMRRIGLSLIEERKAAVAAETTATHGQKGDLSFVDHYPDVIEGNKKVLGRDLLSVLVRSNISSVPSERMSVEEILCQISTFLAAGHETTASALTWTLYALARAPAVQTALRTHLRSLPLPPSAGPPPPALLDSIARLPYLDHVVREALRLHAPVTSTMRVATADDVVPVARPFRDRAGRERTAIRVRRGDIISIPIQAMNRSREVWGADAGEFRPGRWAEAEAEGGVSGGRRAGVPGLWGNMLTFGNGNAVNGHRACIGYRFALSEIKIFLFVLLRDMEVSIDPSVEIEKRVNVVTRPCVKSEPHMGNQMPLYMRRVADSVE